MCSCNKISTRCVSRFEAGESREKISTMTFPIVIISVDVLLSDGWCALIRRLCHIHVNMYHTSDWLMHMRTLNSMYAYAYVSVHTNVQLWIQRCNRRQKMLRLVPFRSVLLVMNGQKKWRAGPPVPFCLLIPAPAHAEMNPV